MFDLARYGGAEELAAQVDAGLPVNLTNSQGDTLLILAAYHKQADVVRALLDRGADLDRANDRGQTALASAVFRQDGEIVQMLLESGADRTAGRQSAVATAEFFDLPEMVALLEGGTPAEG
ncbi:MAG: ankyrin repeat domain-containing protein [Actinomycetes bacterium]